MYRNQILRAPNYMVHSDINQYLWTDFGVGLNPYTTPLIMEIWTRPTPSSSTSGLLSFNNGNNQRCYIVHNNGFWCLGVQNRGWGEGQGTIPVNFYGWQKLRCEFSYGSARLYVDDVLAIELTYTSFTLSEGLQIGRHARNTYYVGEMDDFRAWVGGELVLHLDFNRQPLVNKVEGGVNYQIQRPFYASLRVRTYN